jgi:tetratricopeptide (TPR) repeat protein
MLVFVVATDLRWRACASLCVAAAAAVSGVAVLTRSPQLVDGPLTSSAASSQGHRAAIVYALVCIAAAATQYALARLEPLEERSYAKLGRALAIAAAVAAAIGIAAANPVAQAREFASRPHAVSSSSGFAATHLLAANGSGRWQQWSSAVDEWRTRPLLGGGAGSYYRWWLRHGSLPLQVRNAHSLYLEAMGELGIVGLALLVVALGGGVLVGVRLLRVGGQTRHLAAGFLATYVAFLVGLGIDWIWQLAAVGVVGVAVLGVLLSGETGAAAARRSLTVPAPAVAAVGVLATVAMLIGLLPELRLNASYAAARGRDLETAFQAAEDARTIQPWATPPRLQLALLAEQLGDLGAARAEIRSALEKDSGDWQLWLVDSRIEVERGRGRAARAALRRAAALNPTSALFTGLGRNRR